MWAGDDPPLILCESRSLAGTLRSIAGNYLCPIASTNGQTGGFLRTSIACLMPRGVLYLGDYDSAGGHIEENTRGVLEEYGLYDWTRVATTREQIGERRLVEIDKPDHRFKPVRYFKAVETEALGQSEIQRILTEEIEERLPQPVAEIREREREQRVQVREALKHLYGE